MVVSGLLWLLSSHFVVCLRVTSSGAGSRWRHVFCGWHPILTKYKTLTRQKSRSVSVPPNFTVPLFGEIWIFKHRTGFYYQTLRTYLNSNLAPKRRSTKLNLNLFRNSDTSPLALSRGSPSRCRLSTQVRSPLPTCTHMLGRADRSNSRKPRFLQAGNAQIFLL